MSPQQGYERGSGPLSRSAAGERNPWLVAVVISIATFMQVLDTSIANVALQYIAGSLAASVEESTWVLTSYLVASAVVLPISGWLSGVIGRKRFYMLCVATFHATVRDVNHVEPSVLEECRRGHMRQTGSTCGAKGELAGSCLHIGDKVSQRIRRRRPRDGNDKRTRSDRCYRLKILDRVEAHRVRERGHSNLENGCEQQKVAVGPGSCVALVSRALKNCKAHTFRNYLRGATQGRFTMRARLKDYLVPMGQFAVAAVAGGALLATDAVAQSAREATPYVAIENEPAPKLMVDPPLAGALNQGIVWIQYRVENVHIVPVFGTGAQRISTGQAFTHTLRRPALVVGGPEWCQYNRLGRSTARPAQGARRLGQREPSGLPRMRDVQPDGDFHGPGDCVDRSPALKVRRGGSLASAAFCSVCSPSSSA